MESLKNSNGIQKVGQISADGSQAGTVYDSGGVSPTIISGCHGYAIGYIVEELQAHRQNQLLSGCKLLERNDNRVFSEKTQKATGD